MESWKTKVFMISAVVLSATWESRGEGIPPHLVVPNDFITFDPYEDDLHHHSPISISDDANDILEPHQTHFDFGFNHHDVHPLKKKKLVHFSHHSGLPVHPPRSPPSVTSSHGPHSIHHSDPHGHPDVHPPPSFSSHSSHSSHHSDPHGHPDVHPLPSFSSHSSHSSHHSDPHGHPDVHPPPSFSSHSSHSSHHSDPHGHPDVHPPPSFSSHSSHFSQHSTHSDHPPHSTHSTVSVHTSASSHHPQYPPFPVLTPLNLGYDPYLYTHPVEDNGVYFPEHGYNVVDKLGTTHDDHFLGDHFFPSLGYNLDAYFSDFPVFGYFDYTPKSDQHHRRRRGTLEPHRRRRLPISFGDYPKDQQGLSDPLPLLHRVPRERSLMPPLPPVRQAGDKSDFF